MSEEKHTHVHVLEDGTVIEHSHDHAHGHHHTNTKAVLNRLSRAIGHMEDHIEHCIVDAVEHGDIKAIQELNKAIDRFVK